MEGQDYEEQRVCCYCCKLESPTLRSTSCRMWKTKYAALFKIGGWVIPFLILLIVEGVTNLKKDLGDQYETLKVRAIAYSCAFVFWLMILGPLSLIKCYYLYIPRYLRGCRKRMKTHNLNLTAVLLSLYRVVPPKTYLKRIEETAKIRLIRMCTAIEKGMTYQDIDVTMSGSTAERFNIPLSPCWFKHEGSYEYFHALLSDYDFMITPSEGIDNSNENSRYCIQMDGSGLKTGFVYVFERESKNEGLKFLSAKRLSKAIQKNVLSLRLSDFHENETVTNCCGCPAGCLEKGVEFKWGKKYTNSSSYVSMQGPAITIRLGSQFTVSSNRFYADVTFALKCDDWPSSISDWSYRNRKWPLESDVARIVSKGCHVVPKSQKKDRNGMTWRFSFSAAEVELSELVPPAARLCFLGIKVITKDYLSVACKRIKSYHVKTLFLHTMEKMDPGSWSSMDAEIGFRILFSDVKAAIESRYCPHFWIPQINLFEDLKKRDSTKLLKLIEKIEKSPEKYIEDIAIKKEENTEDQVEEVVVIPKDTGPGYGTFGRV